MITDNTSIKASDEALCSGPTQFPKWKRSWHWCPRCSYKTRAPTVDRVNRTCTWCHGRLYWRGDSFDKSIYQHEDFFCWDTYNGVTGWHHSSFYLGTPKTLLSAKKK